MSLVSGRRAPVALGLTAMVALACTEPVAAATTAAGEVVRSALVGARLWVNPASPAKQQADAWRSTRPADASALDVIAKTPTAVWIGDWNRDVAADVQRVVSQANSQGALAVLVAYNIPNRDCGSHSAGGESSASGYRKWIGDFARGIRGGQAVVVLEPDALASTKCLAESQVTERFALLAEAVRTLKGAHATVYIDAGHAQWLPAADAAARLQRAGVAQADGFALNVSNYVSTAANVRYGNDVSRRVGGRHYIVDTSRNGSATAAGEWCNPSGQSVGITPTTNTGEPLVDAYLWIKQPGESDGACNGGPRAGAFWPEYAVKLVTSSATYASR